MAEKHVHKVYGSFPPWGKSVEFPASGGGGNYVYYSGTGDDFVEWLALASIIKATTDKGILLMPQGDFIISGTKPDNVIGAGFDTSMKLKSFASSFELTTVGDVIAEPSKEWTQITEEEFYKIPHLFTYNDTTYEYEEGQTWGEWVNSSYNDGNFSIAEDNFGDGGVFYVFSEGYPVFLLNKDGSEVYVWASSTISRLGKYRIHKGGPM